MNEVSTSTPSLRRPLIVSSTAVILFALCVLLFFGAASAADKPSQIFKIDSPFVIPEGSTLADIASSLEHEGYIRSQALFSTIAVLRGQDARLHAGTYIFTEPLTTHQILDSLTTGEFSKNTVAITIPEGTRASEIDDLIAEDLTGFDRVEFEVAAIPFEGYLFPDTYYVPPAIATADLIAILRNTFDEKMTSELGFQPGTISSDTVVLASILEREGNAEDNMRLIAGILQKRLSINMPLQVDATLEFERGKGSAELSIEDLETDSPYNTYTRRGLPPTPISNPGITALRAVLEPTPSDYLYYLTGNDGVFYYAKTFEEHKRNKERYLR